MNVVFRRVSHSLLCHKLLSPKDLVLRRITIFGGQKEALNLDKTNHRVIYHFKYIVVPAGVSKAKYKLPIISVPLISACFYFNEPKLGIIFIVGSFLQFALMVAISRISENMIGKIYVNKEGPINDVIISSIDSYGNRKDESFSPDKLYLFENPLTIHLGFLNIKTHCNNYNYKINVRSACIKDVKALKSIFQDIVFFFDVKKANKKG